MQWKIGSVTVSIPSNDLLTVVEKDITKPWIRKRKISKILNGK